MKQNTFLIFLCNLLIINSFQNLIINKLNILSKIDKIIDNKIINKYELLTEQEKYDLSWYVIGEYKDFENQVLNKITVWDKNYVVWSNNNKMYALDNTCSHRSASLACGKIVNEQVMCPYHGYLFDSDGILKSIPGINFTNSYIHNVQKYNVIKKNGWVYLNTYKTNEEFKENIFVEEEANNDNYEVNFITENFNAYSRLVSENSLDLMHIAFVHTFGNIDNPEPMMENPPKSIENNFHYKTSYLYKIGNNTIAKKMYSKKIMEIDNEFILPHTTIARIKFDNFVNTVVTFALPVNITHTKLFVKVYRNYWNDNNIIKFFGDIASYFLMYRTILQDKQIVESIDKKKVDGNFNMKYDKLQNVYISLYKKLVHMF